MSKWNVENFIFYSVGKMSNNELEERSLATIKARLFNNECLKKRVSLLTDHVYLLSKSTF
ncbi:hypothetical protein C1H46_002699 [Malus baccata]|uniref:Uncharacterized protein n=1 Tax=Malus baccata TaxID=106549 RepID=A0A540NLY4_MALBA|nr:hypothetical protein C1H46_002699 [Malus baccata]